MIQDLDLVSLQGEVELRKLQRQAWMILQEDIALCRSAWHSLVREVGTMLAVVLDDSGESTVGKPERLQLVLTNRGLD